jgi:hypothetical protein
MLRKLSLAAAVAAAALLTPAGAYAGGRMHGPGGHWSGHRGGNWSGQPGGHWRGGHWRGHGHWYGGRWWAYGVGSCWRWTPAGYVWICPPYDY